MRKVVLLSALLAFAMAARSQSLPDISSIKLESKSDFNATANDAALRISVYLLNTPLENANHTRQLAEKYLLKWMKGTPEFSFNLDEDAAQLATENERLFVVFMAAMTKYVLENPSEASDTRKVKQASVKALIEYAKNPKN